MASRTRGSAAPAAMTDTASLPPKAQRLSDTSPVPAPRAADNRPSLSTSSVAIDHVCGSGGSGMCWDWTEETVPCSSSFTHYDWDAASYEIPLDGEP